MTYRQSNLELLRMIAMLMIVFSHLLGSGINTVNNISLIHYNINFIIDSFLSIHVNIFLLITGYFGIKFKWKGIINIFIKCTFYSVTIYLISCFFVRDFLLSDFVKRLLFFCRDSPWWFVENYIYLFFLSPVLNICINALTKIQYIKILFLLFFLNCIIGGLFLGKVNITGFNVSQFTFIYFIGGFIRNYINIELHSNKATRIRLICTYLVLMVLNLIVKYFNEDLFWRGYVNPFYIFGAICIFLIFLTFDFKIELVNWIASSAFSVYLIHDEDTFMKKLYIEGSHRLYFKFPNIYLPIIFIISISIFILCITIDKIISRFLNPIVRKIEEFDAINVINNYINSYGTK